MYQLWWVVGGVLESLQNGGLETSVALKRLLGQTDRQIKLLIDEGLEAFDNHPVTDLLNNLLYYVARSNNAGERISEIRAAFNLSELLPGDEQVEHAREALSAPSVKLMKTVAGAIKEDLGRVKDVLDIFVRTGMSNAAELVPQLDLLKKISDTLGVLGLGVDEHAFVIERGEHDVDGACHVLREVDLVEHVEHEHVRCNNADDGAVGSVRACCACHAHLTGRCIDDRPDPAEAGLAADRGFEPRALSRVVVFGVASFARV